MIVWLIVVFILLSCFMVLKEGLTVVEKSPYPPSMQPPMNTDMQKKTPAEEQLKL